MKRDDLIMLPPDADRPKTAHPNYIKTIEEVTREFHEKSDYLLYDGETALLDIEEVDVREFVEWIFERKVGHQNHVQPFEDVQSQEYLLWKKQKREGKVVLDYKGYACWRYNPIIFYKDGGKNKHRIILHDDESTYTFIEQRQFALLSPITYVGRNNTATNARYLYALAFDLDGVGARQIKKLCWMIKGGDVPMPNLITNSGHGLHLYYLLKEPVPLFRGNIVLLNKLKHGLTNIIWNYHTSTDKNTQYQGVLQGFRIPGTLTKFGEKIRAFHCCESSFYTIEDLNKYLFTYKLTEDEVNKLWKNPSYNPTSVTREEAARLWPEWYASRIVEKRWFGKKWNVNRAVYDWWKNKLWDAQDDIKVHHRYWCILTLVAYAVKCNIPREEVLQDAYDLVPKMDTYTDTEDNHFTTQDVDDAMRAYDNNYCTWPIDSIEKTTLFRIEKNRRNFIEQDLHLMLARQRRDTMRIVRKQAKWDAANGRKKATADTSNEAKKVAAWRAKNPGYNNKSACAKDTGLSRPTVRRWWDGAAKYTQQQKGKEGFS